MIACTNVNGMFCPRIHCDMCEQPINDAHKALAKVDKHGIIRFVHKNLDGHKCDLQGQDDNEGWYEIATLIGYLCLNTNIELGDIPNAMEIERELYEVDDL